MADAIATPTADLLDEIAERWEKAWPGPWGWRGYTNGSIELRTLHSGGQRIVTTHRSEPCVVELADDAWAITAAACASCRAEAAKPFDPWVDYKGCPKPENLDTIWVHQRDIGVIKPINDFAVPEVDYRNDVDRIDHPDAQAIAHAPDDVAWLVAEVRRLRSIVGGTSA